MDDVTGVWFQKHGKENWVPVRVVLDPNHNNDIALRVANLLDSSKATDGTHSLSLH